MPSFAFLTINNGQLVKAPSKSVNNLLGFSAGNKGAYKRTFFPVQNYKSNGTTTYRSNVSTKENSNKKEIKILQVILKMESLLKDMNQPTFSFPNNWKEFVESQEKQGISKIKFETFEYYYYRGIKSELKINLTNKELNNFFSQMEKLFSN